MRPSVIVAMAATNNAPPTMWRVGARNRSQDRRSATAGAAMGRCWDWSIPSLFTGEPNHSLVGLILPRDEDNEPNRLRNEAVTCCRHGNPRQILWRRSSEIILAVEQQDDASR